MGLDVLTAVRLTLWTKMLKSKQTRCLTSTVTIRIIRDWGKGGMEVGGEGDHVPIATLSAPE